MGIKNHRVLLDEIFEALRPGGILLYIEADPNVNESEFRRAPGEHEQELVGHSHTHAFSHAITDVGVSGVLIHAENVYGREWCSESKLAHLIKQRLAD